MFINYNFQTKSLFYIILVVNLNQLFSQNIGCIDPNNFYYDENAATFFERYKDKTLETALEDLSTIIYNEIVKTNIVEFIDLNLMPEDIKEVLIGHFMSYYRYT